jgi:hypothetical protein
VVALGCGGAGEPATSQPDAMADGLVDTIETCLQDVAETGELGESFGEARGMAESVAEYDAERGAKIQAELKALEALSSPDERKAKAKEIIDSL